MTRGRKPAASSWWGKNDLLVDGKIGSQPLRLAIVVSGKNSLNATDSDGETGTFHVTEKMADGEYLWKMQQAERDETWDESDDYEVDQRVVLTKKSNGALLDAMMRWSAHGDFDVIAALKAFEDSKK